MFEVLEVPEVIRRTLLCMLEVVEGELCLLEVLGVPEVIRCTLEAVEGRLCLLEAMEVIRCVLLCTLEACGG